jgi:hypothetical protein
MAIIHFIDGEKGGVGKSLIARTMKQYCLDRELPHCLIDADSSNPDVGETYPDKVEEKDGKKIRYHVSASFSESEDRSYEADIIYEQAAKQPVIVNLPAQVYRLTQEWIDRNGIIELGKEEGVSICKWFVCSGGYDSLNFFYNSVDFYAGAISHVLVFNLGLLSTEKWKVIRDSNDIITRIQKYKIPVIEFPKLSTPERDHLEVHRLSIGEARDNRIFQSLGHQRIKQFLHKAYVQFDSTNLWQTASPTPLKSTKKEMNQA